MKQLQVLVLCLGTVVPLAQVSAQMTHEEAVARTTYAKLAYAVDIGEIHRALSNKHDPSLAELESRIAAEHLKFELSNFTSGPVSSIAKQNYADLVTKPEGQDVIDVGLATYNSMEDVPEKLQVREASELGAQAAWAPGQNLQANWNVPFELALVDFDAGSQAKYSRYAAYQVTVSFEGRSRSYQAMFLFGTGAVPVLAVDNVTNSSALTGLIDKSVYPAVLLESPIARKMGVAGWLKSHQVRDPACRGGEGQACCNPVSLTCGVAASDLSASLGQPVSRQSRRSRTLPVASPAAGGPRLLEITDDIIPPGRIESPMMECISCCFYNFGGNPKQQTSNDTHEHNTGNHSWTDTPDAAHMTVLPRANV
jgi:hypothetical protein